MTDEDKIKERWKECTDNRKMKAHRTSTSTSTTTESWNRDKETMAEMGRSKASGPDDLQKEVIKMAAERWSLNCWHFKYDKEQYSTNKVRYRRMQQLLGNQLDESLHETITVGTHYRRLPYRNNGYQAGSILFERIWLATIANKIQNWLAISDII